MAQISDRIPPLDRDGRSEMFWDDNLELFRSWTDPFWFCTKNGKYIYQCSSAGNGIFYLPHPRVWDYLVNGYGDEYRGGTEQIAFFTERANVETRSVTEFMLLEIWLQTQGFDLNMNTFPKGSTLEMVTRIAGPSVKDIGSEPKISFEPYEQAKFTFDTMHQTFMEKAATSFHETEHYDSEYYGASTNDPDNIVEETYSEGYYTRNTDDDDSFELGPPIGEGAFPDADREPDEKDYMIAALERRLEEEKTWFASDPNDYIIKMDLNSHDDPVASAKQMNLDSGDPRDEFIQTLVSRLEGERFFYDEEIKYMYEEERRQIEERLAWESDNKLF
ncbi:MAG: hypothetical protein IKE85_10265 [Mogibacterium sp.]|nr:hypothetical protein [Mogibacterium sp.]